MGAAAGQEDLLLIPEGALRLKGPARVIVELCDGQRTLAGIIEELVRRYPTANTAQIEAETGVLVAGLLGRGVMEYG